MERPNSSHMDNRLNNMMPSSVSSMSSYQASHLTHSNGIPHVQRIPPHMMMSSSSSQFDDNDRDESGKKRKRTNYKDAENSARLATGLNMLIASHDDSAGQKDLKTVSKLFGLPYNTLRDNYLKYAFLSTTCSYKCIDVRFVHGSPMFLSNLVSCIG